MKVVIQRVSEASVTIENELTSSIHCGLLVLAGFETDDTTEDICLLYTSPSPRDRTRSRMPSSA